MRVSVVMIGSRTPSRMRNLAWSTFGYVSGHVESGTSMSSVPNAAVWLRCHASIAGTRFRVRGE